jgi:hypothetical protein
MIVETYLNSQECEWIFNFPHASHTGGVWERMIGISRRILDSMMADSTVAASTTISQPFLVKMEKIILADITIQAKVDNRRSKSPSGRSGPPPMQRIAEKRLAASSRLEDPKQPG